MLHYLGEQTDIEPCGNCDICLHPPQTWDASIEVQKALSCVYRTGQMFGVGHLIDVLRGNLTARVKEWQHDRLSTFAIGQELSEKAWRLIFRQLIALKLLTTDGEGRGALHLTEASRAVLKGLQTVHLREHALILSGQTVSHSMRPISNKSKYTVL
jgi:ATP-dependent DNA helicase RecQ